MENGKIERLFSILKGFVEKFCELKGELVGISGRKLKEKVKNASLL